MEGINIRDNKDLVIYTMLGRMTEHCVQQMVIELEVSMVKDVSFFPDFQVNQMNDYTCDS